MAKVIPHEGDLTADIRQPLTCGGNRRLVLIDADQASVLRQLCGDALRMSCAAERRIHIDAAGYDVQCGHCLLRQDAHMMKFCHIVIP